MRSVFVDTDVVFDILSNREPFYLEAQNIFKLVEMGQVRLVMSSSSLANLFYLCYDLYKIEQSDQKLATLINVCQLIHADRSVVLQALDSPFRDKEDALQYFTAISNGVDYFVTRNLKDYTKTSAVLPVLSPRAFLKIASEES